MPKFERSSAQIADRRQLTFELVVVKLMYSVFDFIDNN